MRIDLPITETCKVSMLLKVYGRACSKMVSYARKFANYKQQSFSPNYETDLDGRV